LLIVVGAIVKFALNLDIGGMEEGTLGWILILAGIAATVLAVIAAVVMAWVETGQGDLAQSNFVVVLILIASWAALATLVKFVADIEWTWAILGGAVVGIVLFFLPD
jgi:hypothetical protein